VRFAGAPAMPAGGRDFAGGHPLDRLYRGADGWVRLGGRQLPDLAGLVRAGLAAADSLPSAGSSATGSPADLPAIAAALAAAVARLPVSQILRRAAAAGVPAVRARQAPELIADEQLIRHGLLTIVERGEGGGVTQVGPGRWLEMPGLVSSPPGPAPKPGEHGPAILAEAEARRT